MQLQISRTGEKKRGPESKQVSAAVPEAERSSLPMSIRTAVAGESQRNLDLDAGMREKIERQFGLDFSGVRLVESNLPAKLGANAVAQGDLIRFAPGAFHPETARGERLLSHELSHVVQQSRGDVMDGAAGLPFYDPNTEHSADVMAERAMRGDLTAGSVRSFTPASAGQTPMLGDNGFRKKAEDKETPLQKKPAWESKMFLLPSSFKERMKGEDEKAWAERIKEAYRQRYNPDNDPELQKILQPIEDASSVKEAQAAFIAVTGHADTFKKDIGVRDGANELDLLLVKKNLCAMARVIYDIPALRGVLSGFGGISDNNTAIVMNSDPRIELNEDAQNPFKRSYFIGWNANRTGTDAAYMVGSDTADKDRRKNFRKVQGTNYSAASFSYTGAHEMGHVATKELTYLIISNWIKEHNGDEDSWLNALFLDQYDLIGNFILQDAIAELYSNTVNKDFIQKNLNFVSKESFVSEEKYNSGSKITMPDVLIGLINPDNLVNVQNDVTQTISKSQALLNQLHANNLTSKYGKSNPMELIAEAFADVYQNGIDANALSKKIVEIITNRLNSSEGTKEWKDDLYNRVKTWRENFYNAALTPKSNDFSS